jgi:hypothetical protein
MFAQVIQGKTSNPEALDTAIKKWQQDLAPGATGWLGSTSGVTEDGRLIAVVRFESEEDARRNSNRPEQDRWWSETSKLFDGDATFRDSNDVTVDVQGDPDQAGFVQVMQGQVTDPARAKELMAQFPEDAMREFRPDVLGSVMIGHDDGRWTQVLYFTSEAEARENERKEPPLEFQAIMEQLGKISVGDTDYLDLRQPALHSPG